jgi:zinc protease
VTPIFPRWKCSRHSPPNRPADSAALVETKKASSVFGVAYSWHDPGLVLLMAEVAQGNEPDIVLDGMIDTVDQLVKDGVTEQDVERIRQQLLKYRELAAADTSRLAVQLSEWAAQGDWRLYFLYRDRLEKVTAADVNRVAQAYLKPDNRTIGQFLPTKTPDRSPVPTTPNLAAVLGNYKGRAETAAGEAFDISPANIESRTRREKLPSGIPVALLEKTTRGHSVNINIKLRYGNEQNLRGLAKAAEFLPELMTRGTKKFSYQELQDALDKHRARLRVSGSAGEATFVVQTTREHLKVVWDLLRQILREPALSEKELDLVKQEQIAEYEKQLTDPQALATTLVRTHHSIRRKIPATCQRSKKSCADESRLGGRNRQTVPPVSRRERRRDFGGRRYFQRRGAGGPHRDFLRLEFQSAYERPRNMLTLGQG